MREKTDSDFSPSCPGRLLETFSLKRISLWIVVKGEISAQIKNQIFSPKETLKEKLEVDAKLGLLWQER